MKCLVFDYLSNAGGDCPFTLHIGGGYQEGWRDLVVIQQPTITGCGWQEIMCMEGC